MAKEAVREENEREQGEKDEEREKTREREKWHKEEKSEERESGDQRETDVHHLGEMLRRGKVDDPVPHPTSNARS